MPRVGFIGVKVTPADRLRAAELTGAASAYADRVLQDMNYLEEFMAANNFPDDTTEGDILRLFFAQWLNSGRAASTASVMMTAFKKFHVNPRRVGEARVRVERFRLTNGLDRLAREAGRTFQRRLISGLPAVQATPPADLREQERQAFWALVCVTGGRPDNVLRIRDVSILADGIQVSWGLRKVQSNATCLYPFAWSSRPPSWILTRWSRLRGVPWPFPEPRGIAAAVNGWLRQWSLTGVTSSSPRETLDRTLQNLVEAGDMSREVYERVMDHSLETALDHYGHGLDADV